MGKKHRYGIYILAGGLFFYIYSCWRIIFLPRLAHKKKSILGLANESSSSTWIEIGMLKKFLKTSTDGHSCHHDSTSPCVSDVPLDYLNPSPSTNLNPDRNPNPNPNLSGAKIVQFSFPITQSLPKLEINTSRETDATSLEKGNKLWIERRKELLQTENSYSHWESTSQAGEDLWTYEEWFYGSQGGLIFESGALDGLRFSNTVFYSGMANWTSMHVEADPQNFAELIKNRIDSMNIHAALCSSFQELHWVQASERGTGQVSGIYEFMEDDYKKEFHMDIVTDPSKVAVLPVIPCLVPKDLFKALRLDTIDMWILDVEGAELDVLQGVDFQAIYIKTIVLECDGYSKTKDNEKRALLKSNGYYCMQFFQNCMCKHEKFMPSRGSIYEGYPVKISSSKEILYIKDGKLTPFNTYDQYTDFVAKTGKTLRVVPSEYLDRWRS